MLGHLEAGHLLDGPGWRLLVAEPAATLHGARATREILDDHDALEFMRGVLDGLVDG